jgi:hypothetical protein
MISFTATDISRIIGSDLDFLRATLTSADELFDLLAPGPERDTLIRHNAKLRLLLAELPQRIAEHSPFKDKANLRACADDAVRRVLAAVTETELFMVAHCGGNADG